MSENLTLSEVCSHIVDCVNRTAPETADGTFYAIGTPAMRGNVIDFTQARRLSSETFTTWTRRLLPEEGDLLIAREAPVGPVVRIPSGGNIAAGQRTTHLRADPDVVDARFLFYLLIGPETQAAIESRSMGSTVPHLRVADLKSLPLPRIPQLAEQQAIAEVLGALDDKIAANTATASKADDFVRARYLAAPRSASVTVGELFDQRRETVNPSTVDASTPYVGLEHFDSRCLWLSRCDQAAVATSTKSRFESGDVLFGKLRPYFHKVSMVDYDGICSTDIIVLTPKDAKTSGLANVAVASDAVITEVSNAAEGTRMPRTNWSQLSAVRVAWPDRATAESLSANIASIAQATYSLLAENRTLAATRDALLPQLMSGKLRVKDAERTVSEVV